MKDNVFKSIEAWKGSPEVFEKDPKDYGVETCIESEEDPVVFQEYLGMLRDIITAVESGESLDKIRITYCKTDWNKLNEKVKEFENAHLPVRADKLKDLDGEVGKESKGTIVLEDLMIKKQFTVLDILKKILSYYD